MKTRAAIVYELNQPVIIDEVDLDAPKQSEVLVKMVASGICHSDMSVINGTIPFPLPGVLGHEGAGIVMEIGEGVTLVQPGDHVMFTFVSACGHCNYCTMGKPNLCSTHWGTEPRGVLFDGTSRFHKGDRQLYQFTRTGTLSEYTVVSQNSVIPLKKDFPLDKAALIGCGVTTGVGAVINTAKVKAGSSVVVIGAGGVGVNIIQAAALVGAIKIIVVDIIPRKLDFARKFGATHIIDASKEDAVEKVMEITDDEGVDYAFEAIGNPNTITQAFHMLRKAGTAVIVGIPPRDAQITLPAALFPYGEKRLIGSMYGSAQMRVDMPLLTELYSAGKLKLDELITKTYTLDQVNDAFEDMGSGFNIRGVVLHD